MCLGQIGELVEILDDGTGLVRVEGVQRSIALMTLSAGGSGGAGVRPGDWLLVHSGFALARLAPDEARDALDLRATLKPDPARHTTEVLP